jgi:hypothetical protein
MNAYFNYAALKLIWIKGPVDVANDQKDGRSGTAFMSDQEKGCVPISEPTAPPSAPDGGHSKITTEQERRPRRGLQADRMMNYTAVRLAFSTARWPIMASSTTTLACSVDAIA